MATRGSNRLRRLATNLPYDVLRKIFLEAAEDRTRWHWYWDAPTGVPRLLPFSLVCKSWTLPAQHVLYLSITFNTPHQLEQFATVATARPDLAAKVQAVRFGDVNAKDLNDWCQISSGRAWDAGRTEPRPIEDVRFEARSTAVLAALRLCPNAKKVELSSLHPTIGNVIVDVLMAAPLLELVHTPQFSANTTPALEDLCPLLHHPTLRKLACRSRKQPLPPLLPTIPITPMPSRLTTLHLTGSQQPTLDLSLISRVGPGLKSLDLYVECVLDHNEARDALETTTSSLQSLFLASNIGCFEPGAHQEHPWIFDVLPKFTQLELLSIDQHSSSSFPNVARVMPSTVSNLTFRVGCATQDPEAFFQDVHAVIPALENLDSLQIDLCSYPRWERVDYYEWEAELDEALWERGVAFGTDMDCFRPPKWD